MTFAGLPIGLGCTANGPTGFTLVTPNPINVPANGCVPVVWVARPVGMPLYSTACYQVTVTNLDRPVTTNIGGAVRGAVVVQRRDRRTDQDGRRIGHGRGAAVVGVSNTGDDPGVTNWAVRIAPRADADPAGGALVALNGCRRANPSTASFALAPGESGTVEVDASFLEPRAFRVYDVILSLDEDGDGLFEDDVATAGLTYGPDGSTVGVTPTEAPPATLRRWRSS